MEDTTNVVPMNPQEAAAPTKAKRTRKPAAPKVQTPEPCACDCDAPTRELHDLENVEFADMTKAELVIVCTAINQRMHDLTQDNQQKANQIRVLGSQIQRHQAFAGYVRQTMDHARDSLLLQADALTGQKG